MALAEYILIGIIFIFLGVLLYIPGRLLAKRKLLNSKPGSDLRLHVTSSGFALVTLMVFVLMLGFSQQHLAPQTEFGKSISTGIGFLSFSAVVIAVTTVFGLFLEMMGFKLFRHSNKDE